jgi:nucleolar protein 56
VKFIKALKLGLSMARNRATRQGGKPRVEFSEEPVITKVTPFGLFAYHKGKMIKSVTCDKSPAKCAMMYFEKEAEVKKLNNTIPLRAKRITEGVYDKELKDFALKNGFSEGGFNTFFQEFSVELTKLKIKFGFSDDKLIIQAVESFTEVTRMLNIFYERLSEWYGYYYPESIKRIKQLEDFADIAGHKRTEESMGYDLSEKDLEVIKIAGKQMKEIICYKKKLEEYLEDKMNKLVPNLKNVAGAVLGAKLIAAAGSLKRLAAFPASTIQLLGAEKSLFRHLRKGTLPPKHGLILQHKMMAEIPVANRGKFARTLSGKINIAAKVDYYSKGQQSVWPAIVKDLEKKAEKMKG